MKTAMVCSLLNRIICVLFFVFVDCTAECAVKSSKNKIITTRNPYGVISLQRIASDHNMCLRRTKDKTFSLRKNTSEFIFTESSKSFTYNGQKIFLGFAANMSFGGLNISKLDYQKNILPFICPSKFYPYRVNKIVIDAGHGGNNFGTTSSEFNVKEKDLVLDIAKILAVNLERCGYHVMLTRTSDTALELSKRSDIANKYGADLFISIHCNHAENSAVSGIETFYVAPNGIQSYNNTINANAVSDFYSNKYDCWNLIFAYCVQTMALNVDQNSIDRGIKASRFGVLKNLHCPGILLECGFISNREECRNLSSRTYRVKLANAIAHGILLYDENLRRVMNK